MIYLVKCVNLIKDSKMGQTKNGGGNCLPVRTDKYVPPRGLPVASPAEVVKISPEFLEIANTYLSCQNISAVATTLDISTEMVAEALNKREVRAYIDTIFLDAGFNNRFKIRDLMDAIISKKLADMDEAEVGSEKDIVDIMALNHKMTMDFLNAQIKLEEAKAKNASIKNQVNVQVNNEGGGSKYDNLIERLMRGDQ